MGIWRKELMCPVGKTRNTAGAGAYTRRCWTLCALSVQLALSACASGGGGGSGSGATGSYSSGSSSNQGNDPGTIGSPKSFETAEYRANYGLGAIGASSAYAAGATGRGVTVGIIDTGIDVDHPEFAGAIAPASTDIVTGNTQFLNDEDGHGTAVAGIIAARKNNSLAHGVAFEATVLAVRADAEGSCASGCAFNEADVAAATDYAVEKGANVINYSLGGGSSLSDTLAASMASAVDHGAILVLAAGNSGGPEPTFPARFALDSRAHGQVIVAGAVDANNQITSFSNRAGSASGSFLVAPGVDILTTGLGGGSALATGTSFATAHVSGAVALVLQVSPFLTPAQVSELLLSTATDLGAPGTDPIYGRGLVNVGEALRPQGTLTVPLGESVGDGGRPLNSSRLRLGSAFGAGPTLGRAIFLDRYGRPYSFDLGNLIDTNSAAPDLVAWLAPAPFQSRRLSATKDLQLNLLVARPDDTSSPSSWPDGVKNGDPSFALSADVGSTSRLTFSHGLGLQEQFGLMATPTELNALLSGDRLMSPYLALTSEADGFVVNQELSEGLTLQLGFANQQPQQQGDLVRGQTTMVVGELARRWPTGSHLALQFGNMKETSSVLDSAGGGALGLPNTSATRFFGLNSQLTLSEHLALLGQASLGLTDPGQTENSLINHMSALRSFGFGAALAGSNLLASDDRLMIAASQPLRVYSGSAVVHRPIGRTMEGRIISRDDSVNLEPDGREVDLELGYSIPLGSDQDISFNWLTRLEPGHDGSAAPEHFLILRLKAKL
jgi:subtilisin family serine protease